jgi:hypothetical protein
VSVLPRVIQLAVVATVAFAGTLLAVQVTESAGSSSTKIVANRIVIPPTATEGTFSAVLAIPGLGVIRGHCGPTTSMSWFNNTAGPIDIWNSKYAQPYTRFGMVIPPNTGQGIALLDENEMHGGQIELGKGTNPGPRRTASVTVDAYKSETNGWCGFQATAVTWTRS